MFGSDEEREKSNEIIKRNTGRIRGDVGHNLSIRLTPTLEFIADELPENAAHMNDLLAQARARDEEVARLAAAAKPAGEANPYKEPRQPEDAD